MGRLGQFGWTVCAASGLLASLTQAGGIETVSELYEALETGTNKKVGVVSEANFNAIASVLPDEAEMKVIENIDELYTAVENGTVVAGCISGIPVKHSSRHAFKSTKISPRASFLPRNNDARTRDLKAALDAAIVRVHRNGDDYTAAANNMPFEIVAVHTCKADSDGDVSAFPFPDANTATGDLAAALASRTFIMGALGPYSWGQDGDYTTVPYTGFWVDFVSAIESQLQIAYGNDIRIERYFNLSSTAVFQELQAGNTYFTEPYYIVDSTTDLSGTPRSRLFHFDTSCFSLGYESTFFTKRTLDVATDNNGLTNGEKAGIAIGAVAGSLAIALATYMFIRERRGNPLFKELVSEPSKVAASQAN